MCFYNNYSSEFIFMKSLFFTSLFCMVIIVTSCGSDDCKECTNCKTKANVTLCEDDFEKSTNFNDEIDNMVSDGCTCVDK